MRRTTEPRAGLARLGSALARSWPTLLMIASIGSVLGAATWSASRERRESLDDFLGHQAALAAAVAADFEHRLAQRDGAGAGSARREDAEALRMLAGAKRLESTSDSILLVARPGAAGFSSTDGRMVSSSRLRAALDAGVSSLVLPRDEAVSFGLPRRSALAGLARVPGQRGDWGLVILASAERLRDRQIFELRRLALTVVMVTAVVATFGFVARRRERRALELERRIAVAALERERETALAKADKMAALAALSTGIAHELGTPLGVILGRVEQMIERTEDPRTRSALNIVVEQVDRIKRIVRGCLALARGDVPALVSTPPESLARRATQLVEHRFRNARVELVCHIRPPLPPVACEPALFEQALVNVLLNACEATPAGGAVSMTVRASDRHVQFVVDDEGVGIPDDVAQRATEPFFSTRLGQGGSGLGLTIAREIVQHHSGSLTIRRRDDARGTRATISIGS